MAQLNAAATQKGAGHLKGGGGSGAHSVLSPLTVPKYLRARGRAAARAASKVSPAHAPGSSLPVPGASNSLAPVVEMSDFEAAAAAAVPSVSASELAHYEILRARFSSGS